MFLQKDKVLQVSEITHLISLSLERDFFDISVEGEISNFKRASSGHCYFSLKDKDAMLSAVIFRSNASNLNFEPKDGVKVQARGRISVYPQRGSYQLVCQSIKRAGQGDILQMLEERKQRLAAEGLFDSQRKKSIPIFPKRVLAITSPTGAAIRDILNVLRRRNPGLPVLILPAAVQGEKAPIEICQQLRRANDFQWGDVIILGRGGGSMEDLLAFSDEEVVRTIAASTIPIISAVGHEIDLSLSDLAADLRAPTPSAAAELVTPAMDQILEDILFFKEDMKSSMRKRVEQYKQLLDFFSPRNLSHNLELLLEPYQLRVDKGQDELHRLIKETLVRKGEKIQHLKKQLEGQSPVAWLKKGYAHVSHLDSRPVHGLEDIKVSDTLRIRLHDGSALVDVKEKEA